MAGDEVCDIAVTTITIGNSSSSSSSSVKATNVSCSTDPKPLLLVVYSVLCAYGKFLSWLALKTLPVLTVRLHIENNLVVCTWGQI